MGSFKKYLSKGKDIKLFEHPICLNTMKQYRWNGICLTLTKHNYLPKYNKIVCVFLLKKWQACALRVTLICKAQ